MGFIEEHLVPYQHFYINLKLEKAISIEFPKWAMFEEFPYFYG